MAMAGRASVMAARSGGERGVMGEINTTPLIDVMLVLLVMLIITVPNQSHAVKVDLPNGPPTVIIDSVKNMLTLAPGGAAAWNGKGIDDATLRVALAQSAGMDPAPELHFRPDAATRYERVDEVLAMTKRAEVKRMGFVGNETYRRVF
jgi:biopolymer transport protein ExbD